MSLTAYLRLIRLRRITDHACSLLEKEAEALKICHTLDGEWGDEHEAKAEYEDRINTAKQLRQLIGV